MDKLRQYFSDRKQHRTPNNNNNNNTTTSLASTSNNTASGITSVSSSSSIPSTLSFPSLTTEEQNEIIQQLGLPSHIFNDDNEVVDHQQTSTTTSTTTKDVADQWTDDSTERVITGALERMKQLGPALQIYRDLNHIDFDGTLRIKKGNEEAIGTVKIKDDEDYGTFQFYGTVRVNEDGVATVDNNPDSLPAWLSTTSGSVSIPREQLQSASVAVKNQEEGSEPNFLFSKSPEQWEIDIMALENGEWTPGMNKDVFGKYKKERPTLNGLFENEQHPCSSRDQTPKRTTDPFTTRSLKKKTEPNTGLVDSETPSTPSLPPLPPTPTFNQIKNSTERPRGWVFAKKEKTTKNNG